MIPCIAHTATGMMNNRYANPHHQHQHVDDIVQDTVGPPPLDPMDSTHDRSSVSTHTTTRSGVSANPNQHRDLYEYSYRSPVPRPTSRASSSSSNNNNKNNNLSHMHVYVPPNDAPLSPTAAATATATASEPSPLKSSKLTVPKNTFDHQDAHIFTTATTTNLKDPPTYATKKTHYQDHHQQHQNKEIYWGGSNSTSPRKSAAGGGWKSSSSSSLYPSFHDDTTTTCNAAYVEIFRPTTKTANLKKGEDSSSSHSSATKYPWDSQSYRLRRLDENCPLGGAAAGDEAATTTSFPSFYGASFHTSSSSGSSACAAPSGVEITIAPGVTAPLRGANETTKAVQQDFVTRLSCWGCQQDVFCIADCLYAVCPLCRTISPLDQSPATSSGGGVTKPHGLGLGLTRETLASLQSECFGITTSGPSSSTTTATARRPGGFR